MKICVLGTGYVGLVTGTVFAELGNDVVGVDIDAEKISNLQKGISPIFEPGLEELIQRNFSEGRLTFTTQTADAVRSAEIVFIAVGTPSSHDGQADLQYVKAAAEDIAKAMTDYRVIVNKSTVPIGTADGVSEVIRKHYHGEFDVVSNPEFLREGYAVGDCLKPDRVVIGTESPRAKELLRKLYEPLNCPMVFTDVKTAEMIKYAANALLATEIAFINSIAEICEQLGADVTKVSEGVKLDHRIGQHAFLTAGPGFGGSCFPKDVRAMIHIAQQSGVGFEILESVERRNRVHKQAPFLKLKKYLPDLSGKKVAVWGLSFKGNTDDLRESVAGDFIPEVLREGAEVHAFDPVTIPRAQKEFAQFPGVERLRYFPTALAAATGADAVVILTDWNEFREMDLSKILDVMNGDVIIDARNMFTVEQIEGISMQYDSVGRPQLTRKK